MKAYEHDTFEFLRKLDDLPGRTVDNAGFFAAGSGNLDADTLYDEMLEEFPIWLPRSRASSPDAKRTRRWGGSDVRPAPSSCSSAASLA